MPHRAVLRAVPLFVLSGLCLSSLDTTAKVLVRDYPVALVSWARFAGHLLLVIPIAWHHEGGAFLRTRHPRLQLLRSALLLAATLSYFAALRFLPIAEASALSFLAPIFIVVLARPLLGERGTRSRWIAVLGGFVGVLILVRPGSAVFHPAAVLAVGMALFNALYQMLTRRIVGDTFYTTLFYTAVVGTAGLGAALPWVADGVSIQPRHLPLFGLVGLLGGLGHWLMIRAYYRAPASMLSPFAYLQMVWPILFGWGVFGELPDTTSALGMAVIVGSGLFLAIQERRRVAGVDRIA